MKFMEDNEQEDDYDSLPLVDDLSSPPANVSVNERIAWLKEKIEKSRIFESTPRTRRLHSKLEEFFSIDRSVVKRCKVIFFMTWISPMKLFDKREQLSLESVFKAHPEGCVVILSKSMDSKPGRKLLEPLLSRGYQVYPMAPDFHLLFKHTPAQVWLERLKNGSMDPGGIPITQNLSNLLRLVVLYKYGGVYLDTDVIILKGVSRLRNSIGVQSMDEKTRNWTTLNNAVLIFDKGHPMLLKFMEEFASSFNGNFWGFNGPFLVTRVVKRHMNDTWFDLNVLPPMAFYPIDWIQIRRFFLHFSGDDDTSLDQNQLNQISDESYGIHLWNKETRSLTIEKGSVIERLISAHCILCQNVTSLAS